MSDGVSAIYSGASDFGKFTATIGGIIGTLIGIIIIGIGVYLLIEGSRRTSQTTGNITRSTCVFEPLVINTSTSNSASTPTRPTFLPPVVFLPPVFTGSTGSTGSTGAFCNITVDWQVGSQSCTGSFAVENEPKFSLGNTVSIFYDPKDPCNSGSLVSQKESSKIGIILIVVGVVFVALVWLGVYLVYRFKFLAAAEGVGSVINIATSV